LTKASNAAESAWPDGPPALEMALSSSRISENERSYASDACCSTHLWSSPSDTSVEFLLRVLNENWFFLCSVLMRLRIASMIDGIWLRWRFALSSTGWKRR
jgi:hypothetical protein